MTDTTAIKACPQCRTKLQTKALTDSDQRVLATWFYCERCGWDERHGAKS